MSTPGQDSAAVSATCLAKSPALSPRPGTASTRPGASEATLVRCKLRWRPTRRGRAPELRRGRLAPGSLSEPPGERLGRPDSWLLPDAAGKRRGKPDSGLLPDAGVKRRGSGGEGAPSRLLSVTPIYRNSLPHPRPSFCDVCPQKAGGITIYKF